MNKTLLISSIVCMILLLYYVADEILSPDYKKYQMMYRERLAALDKSDTGQKPAEIFPIQVRQIVSRDLQRTDRCISCHISLEDPRMQNEKNPLKTHPNHLLEIHDVQKIGCTVCHDGQGRALNKKDAHARSITGWEKPLLPDLFVYSNCLRCHETENFPEIPPILKKGRELFFTKGCLGCHKLNGKGGQIGPDLTNIADASIHLKYPVALEGKEFGSQFHDNPNIAYIYESVKTPQATPADTAMMDFNLSDEEALALTIFLKGLSKKAVPASYLARRQEEQRVETLKEERLYRKYCIACHSEGAIGGVKNINYAKKTVPALNTLAEKMFLEYQEDAEYVADLLKKETDIVNMSPALDVPATRRVLAQYQAIKEIIKNGSPAAKEDPLGPTPPLHMPGWAAGLSDKDIDSIIAYLLGLYPWEEEEE